MFGDELEGTRYTVADGMRDGNVLGFDTIPQPTYKDRDLREVVALEKAKAKSIQDIKGNPEKNAYICTGCRMFLWGQLSMIAAVRRKA